MTERERANGGREQDIDERAAQLAQQDRQTDARAAAVGSTVRPRVERGAAGVGFVQARDRIGVQTRNRLPGTPRRAKPAQFPAPGGSWSP